MKILGICGSLRAESWNLKLLRNILDIVSGYGVEVGHFDLNGLPMFNPDTEERDSHLLEDLRSAVGDADAVIIACPEHNGSMTAPLKNAIEWLSRDSNLLSGRVFLIVGTGPGRSGCARMHVHASYSIESEGGFVLHQPRVLLSQVTMYMDEGGIITDSTVKDLLVQATDRLIWFTRCVAAEPAR